MHLPHLTNTASFRELLSAGTVMTLASLIVRSTTARRSAADLDASALRATPIRVVIGPKGGALAALGLPTDSFPSDQLCKASIPRMLSRVDGFAISDRDLPAGMRPDDLIQRIKGRKAG
jgi:hypothetical protein